MSKITLNNVGSLIDATTAQTTINNNSAIVQTAFDNTLSRDGTGPNTMSALLDMNSEPIVNLPTPVGDTSPLRLQDLKSFIGGGTIQTVPVGGTTGQSLQKNSNTNYDVKWGNNVSSVGLTAPSDFTITNSPITTSGNINAAWAVTPTGTGAVVRATSPTLITPALGTPTALVATNATGTAGGLTAGNVTTNANLTGPITSTGNSTAVASQTGTGSKFVMDTSPALVTPTLGVATATSINKMAITAPGTSSTLAVANSKTFTANNTLTLAGTDSTTLTFQGTDTYVGRTTADTLTNKSISGSTNTLTNIPAATALTGIAPIANGGTGVSTGAVVSVKMQKFTTSGTYTPSTGILYAIIECVGPGGGGGGSTGAVSDLKAGGGGGSGGYSRTVVSAATIGASKAVTIGTGGTGVSNAGGNAGSGATSVGTLCVANAGQGGALNNGSTQFGAGGAGGVVWAGAGANDLAVAGIAGNYGPLYFTPANAPTLVLGGGGASSALGGGAPGPAASTGQILPGTNASVIGTGGSGGISYALATNTAGGAGGDGRVTITEYVNQ